MQVLALDTSTNHLSVALLKDREALCELNLLVKAGHAGMILAVIDEVIAKSGTDKSSIGLIAAGTGPGSFTGIRIGLATAKGLSESLGCPLAGIPTPDIMARSALPLPMQVMPVLDAKKGEVFCALYAQDGSRLTPLMNLRPHEIAERIGEDTLFIGNGCDLYRDVFRRTLGGRYHEGPAPLWHPRASVLGLMALDMPQAASARDILPIYVRASDATLLLERSAKR